MLQKFSLYSNLIGCNLISMLSLMHMLFAITNRRKCVWVTKIKSIELSSIHRDIIWTRSFNWSCLFINNDPAKKTTQLIHAGKCFNWSYVFLLIKLFTYQKRCERDVSLKLRASFIILPFERCKMNI